MRASIAATLSTFARSSVSSASHQQLLEHRRRHEPIARVDGDRLAHAEHRGVGHAGTRCGRTHGAQLGGVEHVVHRDAALLPAHVERVVRVLLRGHRPLHQRGDHLVVHRDAATAPRRPRRPSRSRRRTGRACRAPPRPRSQLAVVAARRAPRPSPRRCASSHSFSASGALPSRSASARVVEEQRLVRERGRLGSTGGPEVAQPTRGARYPAANVVFSAQADNPADVKLVPGNDPSMSTDPLTNSLGVGRSSTTTWRWRSPSPPTCCRSQDEAAPTVLSLRRRTRPGRRSCKSFVTKA